MAPFMRSLLCLALISLATVAGAGVVMEPENAPEWEISSWINGNPGQLAQLRDRVVVIEFFQLWCPGCNSFSIPLFKQLHETFGDREDVLIVSIHSVFEGHDYQTTERLREFVREKGIRHPVGIDAYDEDDRETPVSMRRFETRGTPHIVIVDKFGKLRFTHFGTFDPAPLEPFIERLTKEKKPVEDNRRGRGRG